MVQRRPNNLTSPRITNLKLDPFERFREARGFDEWQENRSYLLSPAMAQVQRFMASLKEYPPRMASVVFNIDQVMQALTQSADGAPR